eukprot:gb/GFBE01051574.1/.p1 GENE.gb/GFBE01051574.1/~~gb/GFBE01051574.1/.p1  ORF type:complete len:162 (+),score=24.08 gb/GFBE01051574.1/:1-486(+)
MLGTNDAKDAGSQASHNWQDCGSNLGSCSYATDYASLIEVIRGFGTTQAGPEIYTMIPPPLMQLNAHGVNQTVINSVLPQIIPEITRNGQVRGPIDIFAGLGGVPNWKQTMPGSCTLQNLGAWPACKYFCDAQSCGDQCHPSDAGYQHMAAMVMAAVDGHI